MAQDTGEMIRITCDACGARFKVPASKAGKKGPCPKCKHILVVPRPEPAVPAGDVDWSMLADAAGTAPSAAAGDDGYDLADQDEPPPTLRRPAAAPAPAGHARPPAATPGTPRITSTGRSLEYRTPATTSVEGPGAGRFVLGIVLACVFAGVGAVIWLVIAAVLGMELGILAWGIGLATGGGMVLGYGTRTHIAGMVAAVLAVGSILAAKAIIGLALFAVSAGTSALAGFALSTVTFDPQTAPEMLAYDVAEEVYVEKGLDPSQTTMEQDEAVMAEAQQRVSGLSNQEMERRFKRSVVRDRLMSRMSDDSDVEIDFEASEAVVQKQLAAIEQKNRENEAKLKARLDGMTDAEIEQEFMRARVSAMMAAEQFGDLMSGDEEALEEFESPELGAHDPIEQKVSQMSLPELQAYEQQFSAPKSTGFGAAFASTFSLFDILWILLALGSAFKLAADV